ncbi:succinate CoA transferase [Planctomyces sp. SH-PL62]|uniref:succinate CoA transferase n=1 Tax=Planctomyces sp. SH-PL62 TaxID=1636152 RepID=UPI00078E245E|nr:succinate CoA transferase [Planctomyces sp. SH-PL62]AMV36300.1 Propionyl-CoA:succinate CoA transferase [Planctomyces sp. SH-PL62]
MGSSFPALTAEEAAELIPHGAMVGTSGFTPAGSPKVVPAALAKRAKALHDKGEKFQIRLLTGASTGALCDDALAEADAISWRAPYMTSGPLRKLANSGRVDFIDMHLSHVAQVTAGGFLGKMDVVIVEASDVTSDGRVYLTTGIGNAPTFLDQAERVIIELNSFHPPRVAELADIYMLAAPPLRDPIPIQDPLDRIGTTYAQVDPKKIVGVVPSNLPDGGRPFSAPDATSHAIGEHVCRFLLDEIAAGRIPRKFLPLQSGVGNVCNAVMASFAANPDFPKFKIYTEVLQDTVIDMIVRGNVLGASTCSLTLSDEKLRFFYDHFDDFADRIVLRPQEISNSPEVSRRLGVIATNTAIEVDVYGHVNSSHFFGTQMMNGLGGSGDFERNAYLSLFMCPSVAKGGRVSTIVPMCTHVDHNEHSVQVIVTEQGLADLRGLAPTARARAIIDNCAHPAYRDYLHHYIESAPMGHLRHDMRRCFELCNNFLETGSMLPDLDLKQFEA